jgi:hypothetical protein
LQVFKTSILKLNIKNFKKTFLFIIKNSTTMTQNEKFKGVIKLDVRDSKQDWAPFQLKEAPRVHPMCW